MSELKPTLIWQWGFWSAPVSSASPSVPQGSKECHPPNPGDNLGSQPCQEPSATRDMIQKSWTDIHTAFIQTKTLISQYNISSLVFKRYLRKIFLRTVFMRALRAGVEVINYTNFAVRILYFYVLGKCIFWPFPWKWVLKHKISCLIFNTKCKY